MGLAILFVLLLTKEVFGNNVLLFNPLLTYSVRIHTIVLQPNITGDLIIDRYRDQYFINGNFSIHTKKRINKTNVIFHRCNPEGYDCEYFQSWNVLDPCKKLKDKNQIWTSLFNAFHPPLVCPVQNQYKIINGTIDIDPVAKFYPEALNYYWKIYTHLYAGDTYIGSYIITFSIFGYRRKIIRL